MADEGESQKAKAQDTGLIPGDDLWTRWHNAVSHVTGRLTPEGEAQYKKTRDDRYEKRDCEKCEKRKDYLLQYSMSSCRSGIARYQVQLIDCISRPCGPVHARENQQPWGRYTQRQHLVSTMRYPPKWGLRPELRYPSMCESTAEQGSSGGYNCTWFVVNSFMGTREILN